MDESAELMLKARAGDGESLRLLLARHQRNLRLFAASLLPVLADVDRIVRAVTISAARGIKDAPDVDALAEWLRTLARTQISAELERLAGAAERVSDPLIHQLVASGRERLADLPGDADPEPLLRRRLQMMPKGALDLLAQRFGQGLPLAKLADLRGLSADDLALALQTACRQIDWSADAFGGAGLDLADYRALDGLLASDPTAAADAAVLRRQIGNDPGVAMRAGRDARTHLLAAAWHAPELAIEARDLAPATRRITNTRRFPTPAAGATANRPTESPAEIKPAAPPARRPASTRRILASAAPGFEHSSDRNEKRSSTTTLISLIGGGILVLAGVLALILRSQPTEMPKPAIAAPSRATTAPTLPTVTPPTVTSAAAATGVATVSSGDRNALFGSGPGSLPLPLVAFSVRRLVGTYTGPLLRVRRSSDNVEHDIGATSTGGLDTSDLTLFVGKNTGQVVRWYDQSGAGNHLSQPSPEAQPLIARGGALEIENGRPVLSFDRARFQHLSTPGAIQAGTLFVLIRHAEGGGGAQGIIGAKAGGGSDNDAYYPIVDRDRNGKGEWWLGQNGHNNKLEFPMPAKRLVLWHSDSDGANPPTISMHLDGVAIGTKRMESQAIVAVGPTVVGCLYWNRILADPFGGSLGEVIMLPPALSAEAQATITANLKVWWRLP